MTNQDVKQREDMGTILLIDKDSVNDFMSAIIGTTIDILKISTDEHKNIWFNILFDTPSQLFHIGKQYEFFRMYKKNP